MKHLIFANVRKSVCSGAALFLFVTAYYACHQQMASSGDTTVKRATSSSSRSDVGVVDLAKGPAASGSFTRSATSGSFDSSYGSLSGNPFPLPRNLWGNPILAQGGGGGGMGGMGGGSRGMSGGMGGGGMGGMGAGGMGGMGGMGGGGMGMGGMGMGGMGMGGMGGMVHNPYDSVVEWSRPETDVPTWLISGKSASESQEAIRTLLNESTEVDADNQQLSSIVTDLLASKKIEFDVNAISLDSESITLDESATFKAKGPLRELLRRLFEPRKLAYIVHENSIEITTLVDSQSRPMMRCYDLAFILPDSGRLNEVIGSIETSTRPEIWQNSGGQSSNFTVGSLLVVSTTESAHHQIESLLYKLSQMNQTNLITPRPQKNPSPVPENAEQPFE